jgi:Cu(I)/Ag(I) efflux system membrane protein CusA/SilA
VGTRRHALTTITWSGQFEYMERAAERLRIVAPLTLLIIFLLLYLNFRNITEPVIVMMSIPFGLIGGIWLIYLNDYNISVGVAVGFIALAGMAAEIGVLVLSFIDVEIEKRRALSSNPLSPEEVKDAVLSATSKRVRPIAMTSISTMAGLVPIRGIASALVTVLILFPAVFAIWKGRQLPRSEGDPP